MNVRRLFFRIMAVCAGLVALPVIAEVTISAAPRYDLPTLQAAQNAATSCSLHHWPGTDDVSTIGTDIVCFDSPITAESSKKFLSLPIREGSIVVLFSLGGDANAALDMADVIHAKHLIAIVNTFCVSACANYLFTAASAKIVLPGGVLGFHGVPHLDSPLSYDGPPEFRAIGLADLQRYIKKLVDRQARFYAGIGVNIALASDYPLNVPIAEFNRQHGMWEYGPDTLRDKFGVRNILYFQTPERVNFIIRLLNPFNYKCKLDSPDVYYCVI